MVYGALVDLGTLGVIVWLLGRDGGQLPLAAGATDHRLAGRPGRGRGAGGQRPRGGVQRRAHQRHLRPGGHRADVRGGRPAPWASVVSVLVVPLVAELAEPVAYLGVVLPRLERRLGRPWLAATIVVALWAAEHAFYPLLTSGGGLDWGFAAYRVGSVLPFLATWTAAYYALGRRLLPIMAARWVFNAGTALALALGLVA